ncbi:hypothetical protein FSP39_008498, partial [Pinctada imbricata]
IFQVIVTPWLGGKVWGSLKVNLGFARGGINLEGYLLETRFPITGSLGFSKFPLDVVYAYKNQTGRSQNVEVVSGEGLRMGTCEIRFFVVYCGFLKNGAANP